MTSSLNDLKKEIVEIYEETVPGLKEKIVSTKRLLTEYSQLDICPLDGISISLVDESLYEWEVTMQGPKGSPYEGGKFILDIFFPEEYAILPPTIIFRTKIYHCNVATNGRMCLLNRDEWSPVMTVEKTLLTIMALLSDCDHEDPVRAEVADQFVSDRVEHDRICKEWTKLYASN